MTVVIEPCRVLSYSATNAIASMVYSIGGPDLSDTYTFDESPVCGYAETITITSLPAFMLHDEATSKLTIPSTLDLNLVGQYQVTVRSEIEVPDDAS